MKGAKKNILIFSGSMLAILSVMYGLLIYPQKVNVDTLTMDIGRMVRMVEAATAEQRQVITLEQQLKTYEDSLGALQERIFERSAVPKILQKIIQVSGNYKLDFSAIYPKYDDLLNSSIKDPQSPVLRLPIEMAFRGQFTRIGRFVEALEKQEFLFSITRLEMAISADSYPDIRAVVRGNLFLRRASNPAVQAKM
ncbi:MAG: type 4a pilus biogenesis protein PilO [Deferribacteres bacterium]|nr:type 4a pilus biogenesis protein PilO [candidate division KSB1 bacterium]MCB9500781.1 type 4a pilus biogenesis protein PilO [Deferribacteres bacterium]